MSSTLCFLTLVYYSGDADRTRDDRLMGTCHPWRPQKKNQVQEAEGRRGKCGQEHVVWFPQEKMDSHVQDRLV